MHNRLIRAACDLRTIAVLAVLFALLLACGCATHWSEPLQPGRSIIVWPNGHIEDGPPASPTHEEDPFGGDRNIDLRTLPYPEFK